MSDCLICTKHESPIRELIVDGEHAVLVHYPTSAAEPEIYPGHLMVEAKRHVVSFGELDENEAAEVGQLIARGSKALSERFAAEHVYVFTIGHMVPHLHVHVVPRYSGTPKEYWGGMKVTEWPGAARVTASEVPRLVQSLG